MTTFETAILAVVLSLVGWNFILTAALIAVYLTDWDEKLGHKKKPDA